MVAWFSDPYNTSCDVCAGLQDMVSLSMGYGKLHRIELQERRLLGVQGEEEEGEEAIMERTVKGEQKKKVTSRKGKEEVEEVEEEKELLKRSWRKRRTEMCT